MNRMMKARSKNLKRWVSSLNRKPFGMAKSLIHMIGTGGRSGRRYMKRWIRNCKEWSINKRKNTNQGIRRKFSAQSSVINNKNGGSPNGKRGVKHASHGNGLTNA